MRFRNSLVTVLCVLVLLASPCLAHACTLWGAAGSSVVDGGTLVAKNRDAKPKYEQEFVMHTPEKGYRFFGLYEKGNHKSGAKFGINEKGLVVASATARIPKEDRKAMKRTSGLNRKLLTYCSSVEEALSRKDLLVGARFEIIADNKEVAVVAIGTDGTLSIRRTKNGTVYTANHFTDAAMVKFNRMPLHPSSQSRYANIKDFMSQKKKFNLADFEAISADSKGSPQNSIWRIKHESSKNRTMATCIVHSPPQGEQTLFIRYANEGEAVKTVRYRFSEIFPAK
jgi:hypothetical protein